MERLLITYSFIAIVGGIVLAIYSFKQKAATHNYRDRAKQLLDSGDWEGAAAIYKKAILERLDNLSAIQGLVAELSAIYRQKGIAPKLDRVLEAPEILRQIEETNCSAFEQGKMTAEVRIETAKILDRYPP